MSGNLIGSCMHRQKPDGWLASCSDKATGGQGASVGLQCSCGIVKWNSEQMVIVMECTVYWESVSSGSPCGNKSIAKASQLRVGEHLVIFFILFFESCTPGESFLLLECFPQWYTWPQHLCYLLFFYLFSTGESLQLCYTNHPVVVCSFSVERGS